MDYVAGDNLRYQKNPTRTSAKPRLCAAAQLGILRLPGSTPMRQQWTLLSNGKNGRGLEQAVKLCRGLFYDVTHGVTQAAGSRRGFTSSSRDNILTLMLAPITPMSGHLMSVMKFIVKETE